MGLVRERRSDHAEGQRQKNNLSSVKWRSSSHSGEPGYWPRRRYSSGWRQLKTMQLCVMLEMPSNWRFGSPGELSFESTHAFHDLILKITAQGDSWGIL